MVASFALEKIVKLATVRNYLIKVSFRAFLLTLTITSKPYST